jgi:hypothetical protein
VKTLNVVVAEPQSIKESKTKTKKGGCPSWLWPLLGILALLALIVGLLFGLGVFGKIGGGATPTITTGASTGTVNATVNGTTTGTPTTGTPTTGTPTTGAPTTGTPTTGAPTTGAPTTGTPTTGAPTTQAAPTTPIKIGVRYPDIETLQNLLNTKSQAGLTPDGKYGPKTSASILAALQKLPTPTTNDVKTDNTQVKDTDSEAIKKAAETNAGVATGGTNPSATAGGTNTGAATGGAGGNYSEIGLEDLMGQPSDNKPVAGTTQPVAGTTQPVAGTTQPVVGTTQPATEKK